MSLFITLVIFLVIAAIDLPVLLKNKNRNELVLYLVIAAITLIYCVPYALDIEVFSPIKLLSEFVGNKLGLNYALWQGHS